MNCKKLRMLLCRTFVILMAVFISILSNGYTSEAVTFTDVSASSGIEQITPSWGVSWGDVNADGWEDIFLSNHMYHPIYEGIMIPPSLLINQGDGTFLEARDQYGLVYDGDTHGGMWGDFNNDGYPDLYQAKGSNQGQSLGPNSLYLNKGAEATFEDIAASAGVDRPLARGRGGCWFEYDDDNLLDLYATNVLSGAGYPSTLFRNKGDGTFEDIGEQAGLIVPRSRGCTPLDYNNDGFTDLFVISEPVTLFKNNGDGTYQDVTRASFPGGKLLAVASAWGDYDNDGDMDLYLVGSDVISDEYIISDQSIEYITEANFGTKHGVDFQVSTGSTINFDLYDFQWRLEPGIVYLGANRTQATSIPFSLSYDDATAQGDPGFLAGEVMGTFIWHENGIWHIRSTTLTTDPSAHFNGIITTDGLFSSVIPLLEDTTGTVLPTSRLYNNQGDGTFVDATLSAGLSENLEGIATIWADLDNDGDLDLYIVDDGYLYNAPNMLYVNNGDGTFTEKAALAGAEVNVQGRGENVAYADYDNDGFLDLFVTNGKGAAPFGYGRNTLLHNNGNSKHWLKIKLVGTGSNRDGIGARVSVTASGKTHVRQQTGGFLKYAQNSSILHFGLGTAVEAQKVEITWPSGILQTFNNVGADQTLEIIEPAVGLVVIPNNTTIPLGGLLEYNLVFTNQTSRIMNVDAWLEVTTPKGLKKMGPVSLTLQPESNKIKSMSHPIPLNAPIGTYQYKAFVGDFPSSWVWSSEGFDFSVVP